MPPGASVGVQNTTGESMPGSYGAIGGWCVRVPR